MALGRHQGGVPDDLHPQHRSVDVQPFRAHLAGVGDDVFVLLAGDTPTDLVVDLLGRREVLRRAEKEWCDRTLAQYRSAATTFVAHVEIDADSITVKSSRSASTVDPRTILTPGEFHEMREAAGNPRGRCLVDVLEYTGRRFRVIQTL